MKKTFVLDTNILLHNPEALSLFEDNTIVLPITVIEELDKFKTNNDELGRNSRYVIRELDRLRKSGNISKGVPTEKGGQVIIYLEKDLIPETGLNRITADNQIISVAYHLFRKSKETNPEEKVVFVSKDINCRVKASVLGIESQDFESQKINIDELYSGITEITVSSAEIDKLYHDHELELDTDKLRPNEFVHLSAVDKSQQTALARHLTHGLLKPLSDKPTKCYTIRSRSKEQQMALDILLDPAIQLVTLVGKAGSGKTLLALAAGMEMVIEKSLYDKISVSRPIIPMGKDIGYLPGSKDDKLNQWMQPIFDNLTYLISKKENELDSLAAHREVDNYISTGDIQLEALTYIRGRSIPKQYVIVDEAQNLTPHEIKTIISRAGEGTKMVLTGDPQQIDSPYLDAESNGLTYAVERLKDSPLHGHITLKRSERSPLSEIAAELL